MAADGATTNSRLVDHTLKRFKMWQPADFQLATMLRDADPARRYAKRTVRRALCAANGYYDDVVAKARSANAADERGRLRAPFWENKTPIPQWLEQ